jgi:hypothetical protein
MNAMRKIQVMATAVIVNGALAIGILYTAPAMAAGCHQQIGTYCGDSSICTNGASICLQKGREQNPLCVGSEVTCGFQTSGQCGGRYILICVFQ